MEMKLDALPARLAASAVGDAQADAMTALTGVLNTVLLPEQREAVATRLAALALFAWPAGDTGFALLRAAAAIQEPDRFAVH